MHEFAYDFRRRGEFIEDLEPNKKSKRYRVGGGKSPLQRCQNIPENESSWVQEFLDGPPPNQEVQETDQA